MFQPGFTINPDHPMTLSTMKSWNPNFWVVKSVKSQFFMVEIPKFFEVCELSGLRKFGSAEEKFGPLARQGHGARLCALQTLPGDWEGAMA